MDNTSGIIETFFGVEDLQTKLRRHLQITIQKNDFLQGAISAAQAQAANQTVQSESRSALSGLSPEARELLVTAASDKSGTIMAIDAQSGRFIQAGEKSFGQSHDRRAMARWDYGMEQLVNLDLIRAQGDKAFVLTDLGYRVANEIQSSGN